MVEGRGDRPDFMELMMIFADIEKGELTLEMKLEKLRDMKIEMAGPLATIKELERLVKAEILETGELPNVPGLDVSIRKGYEHTSWDSKGLQGFAKAVPEIMDFAKKSVTKPSVVIKVL